MGFFQMPLGLANPADDLPSMTKLEARFLTATPADAGVLAELVQLASEGLGLHLWTKLAAGGDPWRVGRARVSSETAALSYRNAVIAKLGGQPVAGLDQLSTRRPRAAHSG